MLELRQVSHRYGQSLVLDRVSLRLAKGEVGCILGPSGCGKTTLLRCVAGFESLMDGEIRISSQTVSSVSEFVAPEIRRVGMVFQDYALLPHLTVLGNVLFGLHEIARDDAQIVARKMLHQVGLDSLSDRYPNELSGGQQQRVAIARALAPQPALLLMDEPFSNLDAAMRSGLGQELKALFHSLGTTVLIATHDHQDAFSLSEKLGVMRDGRLLQWDSAYDIYHRPVDAFVADFVGRGPWLSGNVVACAEADAEIEIEIETQIGIVRGSTAVSYPVAARVRLLLRPDDIVYDNRSDLRAEVTDRRFSGSEFLYDLRLPGGASVQASVPSHHNHTVGEIIGIRLELKHVVAFADPPDTA